MSQATNAEAMERLHKAYQESVNKYFTEICEELYEKKKKEIIVELDKRKTEVILQMVRDISTRYSMQSIGPIIQIEINEKNILQS